MFRKSPGTRSDGSAGGELSGLGTFDEDSTFVHDQYCFAKQWLTSATSLSVLQSVYAYLNWITATEAATTKVNSWMGVLTANASFTHVGLSDVLKAPQNRAGLRNFFWK